MANRRKWNQSGHTGGRPAGAGGYNINTYRAIASRPPTPWSHNAFLNKIAKAIKTEEDTTSNTKELVFAAISEVHGSLKAFHSRDRFVSEIEDSGSAFVFHLSGPTKKVQVIIGYADHLENRVGKIGITVSTKYLWTSANSDTYTKALAEPDSLEWIITNVNYAIHQDVINNH